MQMLDGEPFYSDNISIVEAAGDGDYEAGWVSPQIEVNGFTYVFRIDSTFSTNTRTPQDRPPVAYTTPANGVVAADILDNLVGLINQTKQPNVPGQTPTIIDWVDGDKSVINKPGESEGYDKLTGDDAFTWKMMMVMLSVKLRRLVMVYTSPVSLLLQLM